MRVTVESDFGQLREVGGRWRLTLQPVHGQPFVEPLDLRVGTHPKNVATVAATTYHPFCARDLAESLPRGGVPAGCGQRVCHDDAIHGTAYGAPTSV